MQSRKLGYFSRGFLFFRSIGRRYFPCHLIHQGLRKGLPLKNSDVNFTGDLKQNETNQKTNKESSSLHEHYSWIYSAAWNARAFFLTARPHPLASKTFKHGNASLQQSVGWSHLLFPHPSLATPSGTGPLFGTGKFGSQRHWILAPFT